MAQTESKSCNKLNSFRIATIKKEFGEGRVKLSIFSLKSEILLEFLDWGQVIPFNNSRWKKKNFEKVMLCPNKRNIVKRETKKKCYI